MHGLATRSADVAKRVRWHLKWMRWLLETCAMPLETDARLPNMSARASKMRAQLHGTSARCPETRAMARETCAMLPETNARCRAMDAMASRNACDGWTARMRIVREPWMFRRMNGGMTNRQDGPRAETATRHLTSQTPIPRAPGSCQWHGLWRGIRGWRRDRGRRSQG
jgi:hypothetical protein